MSFIFCLLGPSAGNNKVYLLSIKQATLRDSYHLTYNYRPADPIGYMSDLLEVLPDNFTKLFDKNNYLICKRSDDYNSKMYDVDLCSWVRLHYVHVSIDYKYDPEEKIELDKFIYECVTFNIIKKNEDGDYVFSENYY